jgi:hypothetical protein
MLLQRAAVQRGVVRRAPRLEQLVDAVEIGIRALHRAAERLERRPRRVAHGRDHRLHGIAAEPLAPGDARAAEVALERR